MQSSADAHERVESRDRDHDPLRPLARLRVLDLTRVIAGPVATRFLAAYGADVLRIDPPGFAEVSALLPETTAGKRCTSLDLRAPKDRARFEALVSEADVLVYGLRSNALSALGYGADALRARRPGLVLACLDAYGWSGPWRERRGFDSLVQMSAGLADLGMRAARADRPVPLPVQALDHGTGYLLAAAVLRALSEPDPSARPHMLRLSLARTARFLCALGTSPTFAGDSLPVEESDAFVEEADTTWGPVRRVRCAGAITGVPARWSAPAGPLGTAEPIWLRVNSHPAA